MSTIVGPIGITFHGQYTSTKQYPFLGLVTNKGNSYLHIALSPSTGNPLPVDPSTETTYWALVAKAGSPVELRVTDTAVEWKLTDGSTWTKVIDISDMTKARDEAIAARNAASASATAASLSESSASASAAQANTSKTEAATSASQALNSKNESETIRIEVANFKDEAATSANNSALSESSASASATQANTSKTEAATSAGQAMNYRNETETYKDEARNSSNLAALQANTAMIARSETQTLRDEAFDKVNSISGMVAKSVTLSPGEQATVKVDIIAGDITLTIGVPEGKQGLPGVSPTITSERVGKATTITVVDHTGTKSFVLNDGLDGTGTGNMHTETYDIDGDGTVDRAEIANALSGDASVEIGQVVGLGAAIDKKAEKPVQNVYFTGTWTGNEPPYTAVLTVSGLSSKTIGGASLSDTATDVEYEVASEARIRVSSIGADSITLKAHGEKPEIPLPILVEIRGIKP